MGSINCGEFLQIETYSVLQKKSAPRGDTRTETDIYLTIRLIQGKLTLKSTTTYGIKSSVPPKLRGTEDKVNILFVQLIKQPQTLRGPSPTAWLSNERPADLYDIMHLSAGPSYRNTTISRHERDKWTFISTVYGRSRSSASVTIPMTQIRATSIHNIMPQ